MSAIDAVRNPQGIFINTQCFREEAIAFAKNGYYTPEPTESLGWIEYWEEQERRCINGYSVGGVHITGHHYHYLNFSQIQLTTGKGQGLTEQVVKRRKAQKKSLFPDFWDGDYNYYHSLNIAEHGCTEQQYKDLRLVVSIDPKYLTGGYHMIVGKARRKGYSYKNSAICANIYNTVTDSTVVIGAYLKSYLYPDGTMGKASECLEFLNTHTGWAKARQFVSRPEHKKASYREATSEGIEVERGFRSQIIAVTFQNNPDAARGKDGQLILFEEAGKFDNLKDSYLATKDTLEDGIYTTGMMVIFGCVCAGTKVWTHDGRQINIESLHKDDGILGYGGRGVTKEPIVGANPVFTKPCCRIETSNGNFIECSNDHPLLWSRNHEYKYDKNNTRKKVTFKKAEDVLVGDQLMMVRQIPIFGDKKMWQPRLVGLLIGDGSYRDKSTPELAIGDDDIFRYIHTVENKITVVKEVTKKDLELYRRVNVLSSIDNLKELGIYGQVKEYKTLPKDIYLYDQQSISELLGGYFDADGNVYYNAKKNNTRIVLTCKYKSLLEEVKEQLYKFSVGCNIVKEYRKDGYKPGEVYRLYITKNEDVIQFKKHIKFVCKHKQDAIDAIDINVKTRSVHNDCYFKLNNTNNKGKFYQKDNHLDNLESVIVTKVEDIGDKNVYNLTAGITHTYITNGFSTD